MSVSYLASSIPLYCLQRCDEYSRPSKRAGSEENHLAPSEMLVEDLY